MLRIAAFYQRLLQCDFVFFHQASQCFIKRPHTFSAAQLHYIMQLKCSFITIRFLTAVLAIIISKAATRPLPRQGQEVWDNIASSACDNCNLICCCCRGEYVNNPVDGLGSIGGVQSAQDKVTGLSCPDRGTNSIQVTHFADDNHIGIVAQRMG